MVTKTEQPKIYFDGPEQLVMAAEAGLTNPEVNIVAVRGLVQADFTRKMRLAVDETGDSPPDLVDMTDALYEAVPQVRDLDKFVSEWWAAHGYIDFGLVNSGIVYTSVAPPNKPNHIDDAVDVETPVFGPISLSIAILGTNITGAQKPSSPTLHDDRTYDKEAFTEWLEGLDTDIAFPPEYQSVTQRSGDATIILNHPWPSRHYLKPVSIPRKAVLYDYQIEQI